MATQWLMTVDVNASDADRQKARQAIAKYLGMSIHDAKYHFQKFKKGTKQRWVTTFWESQLVHDGGISEAKVEAFRQTLDDYNAITYEPHDNPYGYIAERGWVIVDSAE